MSHLLEVQGISRRFGGLKAVDGLSFRLPARSVMGLLGPNGSGKTTALNLIAGVLRPDTGSIHLAGIEVTGQPAFLVARRGISRTFQLVRLFDDMTVRENVIAGLSFAGPRLFGSRAQEKADELLTEVGLVHRAAARASDLAYIDRKRLELARALGMSPKVLLLDEWLAGLNPTELKEAIELVRRVRDGGVSILMVEHVIEAIRSLCDHCVIMNAGAMITEGAPHEALSHPEVIRAYLGDDYAGS